MSKEISQKGAFAVLWLPTRSVCVCVCVCVCVLVKDTQDS